MMSRLDIYVSADLYEIPTITTNAIQIEKLEF